MRTIVRTSLLLAGTLVALGSGVARADAAEVIKANVPFPFVVHNETFPAGQYMLRRDDVDPAVLLIQGARGNHASMYVITNGAAGHDPKGDKPCLTFKRVENQYKLANVWESNLEGRTVTGEE